MRYEFAVRNLLLACLLAAPAMAQGGSLGAFTNSGDVGNPANKGSTQFDAATGEYRISGAGVNMWAKEDQFQFVWREMTGNFTITATVEFLGKGAVEHRKAGIMVRQGLDTDAPYADFVVHGNGMPSVQWRNAQGDITNTFDMPFDGPGKFKIKLERNGPTIIASMARNGGELKELGRAQMVLRNPVLAGLLVCSHDAPTIETAVFTNVSVESAAPARAQ